MWQGRAQFCPVCSTALAPAEVEGRTRLCCAQCGLILYENPSPAAAGIVLDAQGRVLLVKRALEPFRGHWALPAGYQEIDEDPACCAAREILEETGIEVEVRALWDLLFQPPVRGRAANLALYLCLPIGGLLQAGADVLEVGWFALEELPEPLGFENGRHVLERLRRERSLGRLPP